MNTGNKKISKLPRIPKYQNRIWHLNGKLMLILVAVPEFQREIKALRNNADFNILSLNKGILITHPFPNSDLSRKRVEGKMLDRFEVIFNWYKSRGYFASSDMSNPIMAKLGEDPFFTELKRIGKKFHLPYEFYCDAFSGISAYVLTGRAAAPSKYPEIRENMSDEERHLRRLLYENSKARIKEFETKYPLLLKILERTGKPILRKGKDPYEGYIKEHWQNYDKLGKWKKREIKYGLKNSSELKLSRGIKKWSQPTTRKIVKRSGYSVENLKTFKKDVNKLTISIFGFPIDEQTVSGKK